MACSSQTLRDTVIVPWTILHISTRRTILFAARLLYHIVFESYQPFNGQGGSRLLLFTVHLVQNAVAKRKNEIRHCDTYYISIIVSIIKTVKEINKIKWRKCLFTRHRVDKCRNTACLTSWYLQCGVSPGYPLCPSNIFFPPLQIGTLSFLLVPLSGNLCKKALVVRIWRPKIWFMTEAPYPVSYTHLTLPTKRIV